MSSQSLDSHLFVYFYQHNLRSGLDSIAAKISDSSNCRRVKKYGVGKKVLLKKKFKKISAALDCPEKSVVSTWCK